MNTKRQELHQLVDTLPENEIEAAKRFLEFLATYDPVIYRLQTAPYDNEPTSEEENLEAKNAWEDYFNGKSIPSREAEKELFG